jgi:tetratricopeptide (TPR) repeat protein
MVQMNVSRKFRLSAFRLCFLFACVLVCDSPSPLSAAQPGSFAAADQAFVSLEYEKADSLYNEMRLSFPDNADLYWKLSRLNITMAESISPKDISRRMPYYSRAVEYARKAVAIDSTNAAAHTWLAASLAVKADKVGSKEKLARAREIKRELDKAILLNPNDDVAWSILGSYYHQVSNIGWMSRFLGNAFVGKVPEGKTGEAEHAFKKAISLNPRAIRHYHELALLYIDQHREQEALQILKAALNKPVLMKSDLRRREEIRGLIRTLSK